LSTGIDSAVHPTVAGGDTFLVAWEKQIEGTYHDLDAALVAGPGTVRKTWGLSRVDNEQQRPEAAWNGRLFLVVWEDDPTAETLDLYGTRVTACGLTLDGWSSDSCPAGDDPGLLVADGPSEPPPPVGRCPPPPATRPPPL
jgi:hypothetical protein